MSKSGSHYTGSLPFTQSLRESMPPSRSAVHAVCFLRVSKRAARILDIGCGEGRNGLWLASEGSRVTDVDVSRENIEALRRKVGQIGIPEGRIETVCADMLDDDISARGRFDAVLDVWFSGSAVLPHDGLQELRTLFSLLHPLLGNGGLLISEFET